MSSKKYNIFENNIDNDIKVGDYVIADKLNVPTNDKMNELDNFLRNTIGVVVYKNKPLSLGNNLILIAYDNIPNNLKKYFLQMYKKSFLGGT